MWLHHKMFVSNNPKLSTYALVGACLSPVEDFLETIFVSRRVGTI